MRTSRPWTARVAGFGLLLFLGSAALLTGAPTAQAAAPSAAECPDLTGTYEPRSTTWTDAVWIGGPRPKMQSPQFAAFARHGEGYTLTWLMPREEVLAQARALAERNPRKYGLWLDMVLRDPDIPLPHGVDAQEWMIHTANVGPVLRYDVELPLKRCEDGWFLLAGPGLRVGPPDNPGGMKGTREVSLWLGRDTDGALVLKRKEQRTIELFNRHYVNVPGMRLWSSSRQETWPAVPACDLTPIRAEELPAGDRPSSHIPPCQITEVDETLFFQRLEANLPPGAAIENTSSSIIYGHLRPDGTCDPTPYTVSVSAHDAAGIAQVADYLRSDPFIRRIDGQQTIAQQDGFLEVKFRMQAAPTAGREAP